MPEFRYEGYSALGKHEAGVIPARDEGAAYQALLALGITATRLSDKDRSVDELPWYRREIRLSGGRLSLARQADMAGQLAVLFRAGLPVAEIVDILARSAPGASDRLLYGRMGRMVADGARLSDAFAQANGKASALFLSVLRIADLAPDPGAVMGVLAAFLRRQEQARRRFLGALIYPAILILTALGVLLVVALFLAPNLLPMFEALDRPAPALLRFLGDIGDALAANPAAALTLALAASAGFVTLGLLPAARETLRRAAFRVPVLGAALRNAELSRLTYCLGMLTGAGLPLTAAFRETAEAVGGYPFGRIFAACAAAIEEGGSASDLLAAEPQVPQTYLELFRVGESTNRLNDILPLLAADLENRADQGIARLLMLLTPALTLVIGGGIALLVYAVMSAILSVNELAF